MKVSCGSHLTDYSTREICDSLESSTADIDQRIGNRLSADTMLDLVVSGRHAADTTAEFRADTTVVSGKREEDEDCDGES